MIIPGNLLELQDDKQTDGRTVHGHACMRVPFELAAANRFHNNTVRSPSLRQVSTAFAIATTQWAVEQSMVSNGQMKGPTQNRRPRLTTLRRKARRALASSRTSSAAAAVAAAAAANVDDADDCSAFVIGSA